MAVNKIPEVINDMRAYIDGADDLIGVNEVELPDLKSLTEDIEGIGVAGKIEAPIAGHFDSLELKMTWQVPTKTSSRLVGGSTLALELYSDIQNWDSGANDYEHEQYRVAVRGRVKSHNPGKFKAGSKTDSETVIECTYLKSNGRIHALRNRQIRIQSHRQWRRPVTAGPGQYRNELGGLA